MKVYTTKKSVLGKYKHAEDDNGPHTNYLIDSRGRVLKTRKNKFTMTNKGVLVMEVIVPFPVALMHLMGDDRHVLFVEWGSDEDGIEPLFACLDTVTGVLQSIVVPSHVEFQVKIGHSSFFLLSKGEIRRTKLDVYEYKCGQATHIKKHEIEEPGGILYKEYNRYTNQLVYTTTIGKAVCAYDFATSTTHTLIEDMGGSRIYNMTEVGDKFVLYVHGAVHSTSLLMDTKNGKIYDDLGDITVETVSPDGRFIFSNNHTDGNMVVFDTHTKAKFPLDIGSRDDVEACTISGDGKYMIVQTAIFEKVTLQLLPFDVPLVHRLTSISHENRWATLMSDGDLVVYNPSATEEDKLAGLPEQDARRLRRLVDFVHTFPVAQTETELLLLERASHALDLISGAVGLF